MDADDLCWMDACELEQRYQRRDVSPVEVVDALISRIERLNPGLNAFITITADSARTEARRAERDFHRGERLSRLHGIPVAIKDVISTRGIRTTMGSAIYRDFIPDDDAFVVRRLKEAGAIIIGKTHTHEFAFAPVMSDNPFWGRCRNPWDAGRIAGASSGGSGAAVAAGMAPLAIGTDTSGSVRIPASLCGVAGLKPTRGLIDCAGAFPVAASLDTVGPMARSARDTALALDVITGQTPRSEHDEGLRGVRVGVLVEHLEDPIAPEVRALTLAAIEVLRQRGASVDEVSIPMVREAFGMISVILGTEVLAVHEQHLREQPDAFGKDVLERLLSNRPLTRHQYAEAQRGQALLTARVHEAMHRYDVLVGPTMPIAAPAFGQETEVIGTAAHPLIGLFARFTRLHSLTGFPAISVPCGRRHGLPAGLQISGRMHDDAMVLRVARAYQRAAPFLHARPSPGITPAHA